MDVARRVVDIGGQVARRGWDAADVMPLPGRDPVTETVGASWQAFFERCDEGVRDDEVGHDNLRPRVSAVGIMASSSRVPASRQVPSSPTERAFAEEGVS